MSGTWFNRVMTWYDTLWRRLHRVEKIDELLSLSYENYQGERKAMNDGTWLEPGDAALDADDARRVLVEIPADFSEMQIRQPDLALAWRMATRRIFQTYFARGFRVVDFFFAREAGRGQYLLAQKPPE